MKCLGKGEMYFTEQHNAVECSGRMLFLPNFWKWTPSGNLNAIICEEHAKFAQHFHPKSYLKERLGKRNSLI